MHTVLREATCWPKLNLCLYVGPVRADGYHSIISIFQRVHDNEYNDKLRIFIRPCNEARIEVRGLECYCNGTDSSVFRAASLYLRKTGLTASLAIEVEKGIPSPSGLGGPASDAAGVLILLNDEFNFFSHNELVSLSAEVGSDVPFFTSDTDAAFVSGRGEIVEPIASRTDLRFSILPIKAVKTSTRHAYEVLDARYKDSVGTRIQEKESFFSKDYLTYKNYLINMYYASVSTWAFENDFEL